MPLGAAMRLLHLIEDAEGVSHFTDAPVALPAVCAAHPDLRRRGGDGVALRGAALGLGRHETPLAAAAGGALPLAAAVRPGDNDEVREFQAGAISRMQDVTCSGHTTTVLGEENVRRAIAQVPTRAGDVTFP